MTFSVALHPSSTLGSCSPINSNCSNGCVVVSLCGIYIFLMTTDIEHLFRCVLITYMSSFVKYTNLLLILKSKLFFIILL